MTLPSNSNTKLISETTILTMEMKRDYKIWNFMMTLVMTLVWARQKGKKRRSRSLMLRKR